jgi:signal transduction histidine kinase
VSPMRRQIYVLDRGGEVLFRNEFAEIEAGQPLPYPFPPAGARAASVFRTVAFDFNGSKHLAYSYPMAVTGWRVVLVYPQDKAYALVSGTRRSILATLGAAVLLSLALSALLAWFHSSVIIHAKEALQRYADKLEQTNAELDAFASSISHDLSAPLRHIMGYADILEMRLKPSLDPKDMGHLEKIASAARHLHSLIHDVLVFSKMGRSEIHKTRIPLSSLLDATRARLEPDMRGRAIAWRAGTDATLWGDPTMLQLVLFNLISNALKFTRLREHALIEIGARPGPDETTVFVSDNGVGFDEREKDKLFGLFQRLHDREDFEGHGVGLAHVRRIIAKHGGRTWAEGRPGRGATFYFSLPVESRSRIGE